MMDLTLLAEAARELWSALIRMARSRRSEPVSLGEGQFTSDEAFRIGALRRQYVAYPDSFRLDVNYRHAHFARWLVQRGRLGEELEMPEDVYASAHGPDKWTQVQP
jgi:hypothetical protein